MSEREQSTTRRQFLKTAGLGTVAAVAAGGGFAGAARGGAAFRTLQAADAPNPVFSGDLRMALGAGDGHIILPNRPNDKPLYIFGFVHVPAPPDPGSSVAELTQVYKGNVQHPAPILGFRQANPPTGSASDVRITLTNLGLVGRPDLTDSHTIHWHGFRAPVTMMDGVPEVSIAVPEQRQFTYFYRPHDPGTYMYHCHFEDVEHVQMGMTSIVFVRPSLGDKYAYNDPSTAFDREYAILLNEVWTALHDNDENIQESIHTNYKPDYFTLNGRVYPQTILPSDSPSLPASLRLLNANGAPCQPISSLIQCNGGEKVLLRLANLGYQQHAMQLPRIRMKVVGEDATLLRSTAGVDLSYMANTLYMGPGEARDVIFTAPAFVGPGETDPDILPGNPFNRYFFKNRSAWKLSNGGARGPGGMMTEVRVYQNALPAQAPSEVNKTYV